MPLTDTEIAEADKFFGRMEKSAKVWRLMRWVVLPVAILGIAAQVWSLVALAAMRMDLSADPGKSGLTSIDLALTEMFCIRLSVVLFVGFVCAMAVGQCLANWNKAKKDCLLIRLGRSYIDSQRATATGEVAAPSGNLPRNV